MTKLPLAPWSEAEKKMPKVVSQGRLWKNMIGLNPYGVVQVSFKYL